MYCDICGRHIGAPKDQTTMWLWCDGNHNKQGTVSDLAERVEYLEIQVTNLKDWIAINLPVGNTKIAQSQVGR